MKVAIVSGGLFWAGNLAESLAQNGYNCSLVLGCSGRTPGHIPTYRAPIIACAERGLSACLSRQRGLIERAVRSVFDRWATRHIARMNPDLVIAWSSWGRGTLRWCAKQGIMSAVERGSAHIEVQNDLTRREFARWGVAGEAVARCVRERELEEYELASWITVLSSFARDSFLERGYPSERLEVVPLGVDPLRFHPRSRRKPGFSILFVGLVDLRKGVPYLLQAYQRVRSSSTELILIGSLKRPMRTLLDGLGIPYTHIPTAPAATVARLMAEASVLVHPSIEDGFARVLIEAMASRTPVITTTNTAATDVITEGVDGFVVPPGDVDALAERLRFLRDHPDQVEAMGAAAYRKVQGAFTWEHYGRRITDVIRRRTERTGAAGRTERESQERCAESPGSR